MTIGRHGKIAAEQARKLAIAASGETVKLWRPAGGSALVSIVSAFLGFGPYYNSPRVVLLQFGAPFCAAVSLYFLYLAIAKSGQMAFTVGPSGILDERISKDVIPWSSVEAVSTWRSPSLPKDAEPNVLLKLKPSEATRLNITPTARFKETMDRTVTGSDGFIIGQAVTDVSCKRLLEVIEYYLPSAHD
jgi:hypothetical protein